MGVAVGSFQVSTGVVGTKYSVGGLAFRPAFVFFRWSGANAPSDSGPTQADLMAGWGAMLENGKRGCESYYAQNAADPYSTRSALWNTAAIVRHGTATSGRADFSSMNDDGFSVVVDEVFGAEITVFYWAISGSQFNILELTEAGATGVVAYTGAGFRPTMLMLFGDKATAYDTVAGGIAWSLGVAIGSGANQNAVFAYAENSGAGSTDSAVYCRRTECGAILPTTSPGVTVRVACNGFTDDGFELDWLERDGSRKFLAIVADGRWFLAQGATATDLNPFDLTGMTWTPEGVLVVSRGRAEDTQDVSASSNLGSHSIGAGVSPSSRWLCGTRHNNDGGTTASNPRYYHQVDELYGTFDNAGAVVDLMDISSAFTPDTVTHVMDDASPSAFYFWELIIGPPIIEFRQRLVKYQQNTYSSRAAGRTLVRDVLGRTVPNHDVKPDNFIFAGGPTFPTPTKYASLIVNPATFYVESVQATEDRLKIETNREALFQSLMRRLAG